LNSQGLIAIFLFLFIIFFFYVKVFVSCFFLHFARKKLVRKVLELPRFDLTHSFVSSWFLYEKLLAVLVVLRLELPLGVVQIYGMTSEAQKCNLLNDDEPVKMTM